MEMMFVAAFLIYPILLVIVAFLLYWVVRLAVRHALRDGRAESGRETPGPTPAG